MDPTSVPRHVFVSFHPDGPHAGPVTIGLFGVGDGALLPVFSSREGAMDFAIRTLGSPPSREERWDAVELPVADLLRFLEDGGIHFVALEPSSSGDVELLPKDEFADALRQEAKSANGASKDYRDSFVRSLIYGDVS